MFVIQFIMVSKPQTDAFFFFFFFKVPWVNQKVNTSTLARA